MVLNKALTVQNTFGTTVDAGEFKCMKDDFSKCIPAISFSTVFCEGHPYIVVNYGLGKARIPLDEQFDSGDRLGDKFRVGDVTTIILTDKPQDQVIDLHKKDIFNFTLDGIIAYSFTYTIEMQEIYSLYRFHQQLKTKPKKRVES